MHPFPASPSWHCGAVWGGIGSQSSGAEGGNGTLSRGSWGLYHAWPDPSLCSAELIEVEQRAKGANSPWDCPASRHVNQAPWVLLGRGPAGGTPRSGCVWVSARSRPPAPTSPVLPSPASVFAERQRTHLPRGGRVLGTGFAVVFATFPLIRGQPVPFSLLRQQATRPHLGLCGHVYITASVGKACVAPGHDCSNGSVRVHSAFAAHRAGYSHRRERACSPGMLQV